MKETAEVVVPVEKPVKKGVRFKNELNQELVASLPNGRWHIFEPNGYATLSEADANAPHIQDLLKAGHIALT